ncbi:hypothetical protein AB4144_03730, partial [Rhizobiaceae sp. 2RAB30]
MRAVLHAPVPTTAPVTRLAASQPALFRKASIGPVDDPLEREADRTAEAVMRGDAVGSIGATAGATAQRRCAECAAEEEDTIQRKCSACEAEEKIQKKPAETAVRAVSQGGEPLSPEARAYFEPRFRRDFSDVRIHA